MDFHETEEVSPISMMLEGKPLVVPVMTPSESDSTSEEEVSEISVGVSLRQNSDEPSHILHTEDSFSSNWVESESDCEDTVYAVTCRQSWSFRGKVITE